MEWQIPDKYPSRCSDIRDSYLTSSDPNSVLMILMFEGVQLLL